MFIFCDYIISGSQTKLISLMSFYTIKTFKLRYNNAEYLIRRDQAGTNFVRNVNCTCFNWNINKVLIEKKLQISEVIYVNGARK